MNLINNFVPNFAMPDTKIPDIGSALKTLIPNISVPSIPNFTSMLDIVTPLEEKVKGIPLWKAGEPEQNILVPKNTDTNTTTNSSENNTRSINFSPTVNITVNGGEQGIEQKFRQIIEDVLNNLKNDAERVSFV